MGYKLDNKDIQLTTKSLHKISTGKTGNIYKFKDSALKVFKDDTTTIEEETAKYLTSISTDRILLPRKLLFYNKKLKGFTLKSPEEKGSSKRIITLPKNELVNEISISERDIETLSRRSVLLNGVSPENSIFNGELYLTDPSEYSILELFSTEELERLNKYQLHLLITELITQELRKSKFTKAEVSKVKEILSSKDDYENSSDFFKNIISNNDDSIKQFVKSI